MANKRNDDKPPERKKMQALPASAKVSKRPLLRPQIPSPYAGRGSQKVVYVGTKTPFMSAFKRVKFLLKQVDKRSMQSELTVASRGHQPPREARADEHSPRTEEVAVKATGKAIDKALGLALFLQSQADLKVTIRTSTVDAIDDLQAGTESLSEQVAESEALPEARLRNVSVLEVGVTLR